MPIQKRHSGRLVAVTGASQSGKSVWTSQQVATAARLFVWDYKGDWRLNHRCRHVSTWPALHATVLASSPAERIAYHAPGMNREAFDTWCRFAWIWLQHAPGSIVVEETSSVTHAGKAPDAWGDLCRMGLGFGADIYAVTQRPAESDKTALGNATLIHCHRVGYEDDARYMSKLLRVPQTQVDALLPYQWIERDESGAVRTGGPRGSMELRKPSRKTSKR